MYLALTIALFHGFSQSGPNATVLLLTAGVLLIYVELNRPGWVVPGAIGLLLFLLALAAILKSHPQPFALALLATGFALLLFGLVRPFITVFGVFPSTAFVLAYLHLGVAPSVSLPCGLALGLSSYWLTHIARRARANKGLDLK